MKKAQDILNKILTAKGNHVSVRFLSNPTPASPKKMNAGILLEKVTQGAFRAGIDYSNISEIKEAIAAGERGEVQPIWHGKGRWVNHPYICTHADKGGEYVRLYPSTGSNQSPKVLSYKVNGQEVSKEVFESYLPASKLNGEVPPCLWIKSENILDMD